MNKTKTYHTRERRKNRGWDGAKTPDEGTGRDQVTGRDPVQGMRYWRKE
jgi:hypothetical protein